VTLTTNARAYRVDMPDEPTSGDTADAPQPVPATPLTETTVDHGYSESGVPTFESVRDKIETRFGAALGSAELDAESPEGRSVEEQYDARQRAAAERLAEIRESMHRDET
jgi:phage shock protein A